MPPAYAAFAEADHRERLERARRAVRLDHVDVCVSVAPENLYYLGGYDSWVAVNGPQAMVFSAQDDEPTLVLRDVDRPLAVETTWIRDIRTYRMHRDDPADLIARVVDEKGDFGAQVGIEMQSYALTFGWGRILEGMLPVSRLRDVTLPLGALRWIKSPAELGFMRQAAAHANTGLAAMRRALRPGMTELGLAAEIEYAMRRQGCDYWAIPVELASGERSEGGHATPRARIIEPGDLVHAELAGVSGRYHAVAIATMAAGRAGAVERDLHDLARRSLEAGLGAITPGIPVCDVEEASLAPLREAGLEEAAMMRFGYGIGIAYPPVWLETLQISRGIGQRLEPGMTFVLHACVTPPGSGSGVVVGGTWLMLEDGLEMLAGSGACDLEETG